MEFSEAQWGGVKEHCESAGVEFMSTPSCLSAVDLLETIGIRRYKIGSGDTENRLLLERVARTGKPIILSTGVSTLEEIDAAVEFIAGFGNDLALMQCTSEYPVPPERVGLNQLSAFRDRYRRPVGLSDHSGTIYPALAAVALGALYIEIHVVFDRRMFGPDSTASLTIDELKNLVTGVRIIEKALSCEFTKERSTEHGRVRDAFGKTLSVRRDMRAGETISFSDLESKKPAGQGVPAADYAKVIGKRLQRNVPKWDFLRPDDLA
jgi:N-acetylneuraminate synthase